MESPNPIPDAFVVKNGSNTRSPFSEFIPGPVSSIDKRDDRIAVLGRYQPKSLCGCGTSGHCFDRVLDQIQDYLLKLGAVGHYLRKVFLKFG